MTQLISNVLMQPKPDAVERPMTLVKKLEQKESEVSQMMQADDAPFPYHYMAGKLNGAREAIDIVKQHQTWHKMPSDEKPQDMQAYNLLLKNDSAEYPTLYSVGLFRQYASGHVWVSLVESEKYIDESKILAWQRFTYPWAEIFESLKQPPREPQYLISKGGYWYRPDAKGYTASKHEAGRFSKEFAERHAKEVLEVRIFEDKENR
ncbi:hypothetical protein ENHY17A_50119 [Moraxellaceae bacterium 17A]|nr:hypothetical protein ENHY17A_50119 [Moraxellaceae bacterium 17A]